MSPLYQVCSAIARWLNEPEPHNPGWSPETWEIFQVACRVHGVAPLLYESLRAASWVDPWRRQWLANQHDFNTRRIAKMQAELRQILALFGQHRLTVIPLKGAVLTARYYENAGCRPMADLDLLVRPEAFAHAALLLKQLGYEQGLAHWKHTEFIKPDNRNVVSKESEHPDNPRGLEIHVYCRESFGGPTIDLTDLMWQQARPGRLLGEPAMLVYPEALWLHLLIHTTYHVWQGQGRLIHLIDLARLTPHLNDPRPILNSIDARFTYPSLRLLKTYSPKALEDVILETQQAKVSSSFRRWAESLDLVSMSYLEPKSAGLYLLKALKFTEGRPREVVQALRFALLPRLEEISLDHPRLASSKVPWLAYFFLPRVWIRRVARPRRN